MFLCLLILLFLNEHENVKLFWKYYKYIGVFSMTNTGLLTNVMALCIQVQTRNTTNPGRIRWQQNEVNISLQRHRNWENSTK